jgi:cobalt-zinc-cadmium efflux system membrane fusion protein
MQKISKLLLVLIAVWINYSCTEKKAEPVQSTPDEITKINAEQFKSSNMKLGFPAMETFRETVKCKGNISAPANAMSKISPPIAGKVNSINIKLGDHISAGQAIASISGNEFMELQQRFAEASAAFSKSKVDYERAKSLWAEKIGAEKDFLAAQTTYRSASASYQSLRSRITALGLKASSIENGHMYTSYPVVAPICGHLTKINAVIGQYIDVNSDIAEIVNVKSLQLKLSVYESDVRKIKIGQTIIFRSSSSPNNTLSARLVTFGKTVNPDTKTIDCIAMIDKGSGAPMVNNSYVEASIIVSQHQAMALPVTAVQKLGSEYFVYVIEKRNGKGYSLKRTPVNVGVTEGNFIEIRSQLPKKEVVVQGLDTM